MSECLTRVILLGLGRDDDTFTDRVRKVVCNVLLVVSPVTVFFSLDWLMKYLKLGKPEHSATAGYNGRNGLLVSVVVGVICFVLPCLFAHLAVRFNAKRASNPIMMWVMLSLVGGFLGLGLSTPVYPHIWPSFTCGILAILSHLPRGGTIVVLLLLFASQVIMAINNALLVLHDHDTDGEDIGSGYPWLISVPDPHYGEVFEQVGQTGNALSTVWLGFLAVWAQALTYRKMDMEQREALDMSAVIAHELERYNTAAVRDILRRYEKAVNVDLAAAFEAIANNLDKYRGFLPNYMFQDLSDSEMGKSTELVEEDGTSVSIQVGSSLQRTESALSSIESIVTEELASVTVEEADGESSQSSAASTPRSSARRKRLGGGHGSEHPHPRGDRGGRRLLITPEVSQFPQGRTTEDEVGQLQLGCTSFDGHQRLRTRSPIKDTDGIFCGLVSYLVVDFTSASVQGKANAAATHHAELVQFVNIVYDICNSSKGSLHSMVGDTLHASWNATTPVPQPEVKAALCIARILKSIKAKLLPTVCAALCSGYGAVTTFSTQTRQQALLVHLPWQGRLDCCLRLARQCATVIVDESTATASNHSLSYRCADMALYYTSTGRMDSAAGLAVGLMCDPSTSTPNAVPNLVFEPNSNVTSPVSGNVDGFPRAPPTVRKTPVFELLGEAEHNEDTEWMYQLEKKEAGEAQVLSDVLSALDAGDRVMASNVLETYLRENGQIRDHRVIRRISYFLEVSSRRPSAN